jgi:integrase
MFEGIECKERLTVDGHAMAPTPANINYANRLAAKIRKAIAIGTFSFAEYFPDSPRCEKEALNSFGALADMWYDSIMQLTGATISQYASAIRFWKETFGADMPIDKLTHKLIKSKIGKHKWPSAKTHNNYLIALRGIFALEYTGTRSISNPMIGIENLKTVKTLPDPLSAKERDLILGSMAEHCDPRIWAYFSFAFYTGMRPEELIALRWSDIDFQHGVARVQRVRTFKGSVRDGSKTHAERDVDLVPQALEALRVMKKYTFMKGTEYDIFERPEWHPSEGSKGGKPTEAGPWHDERSQRDQYWKPTLRRLGIRMRRAYATRHTYCTVALMGGVNPAYIADQAGHSVKMLLEKYARWMPGEDGGNQRRKLEAAMQNSSQIPPNITKMPDNQLIIKDVLGRRDWTRTNNPPPREINCRCMQVALFGINKTIWM